MQDNNKQPGGDAMSVLDYVMSKPTLIVITHPPSGEKRSYYYEKFKVNDDEVDKVIDRFFEEDRDGSLRRYPLTRECDMDIKIHFLFDGQIVGIFDEEELEEDFA